MLDLENLAAVFGSDDIHFVTDHRGLLQWIEEQGLAGMAVADVGAHPPENVVLAPLTWDGDLPTALVRSVTESLSDSRVLSIPIGAFDSSMGAAKYTIEWALRSDFLSACERGAAWADEIRGLDLDEKLRFTGRGTDIEVALAPTLAPGCRLQAHLNEGERISAISYFEFEFETLDKNKAEFSVEGTLDVTGMLVARGSTLPVEVGPRYRMAQEFVRTTFAGRQPEITVVMRDNHFQSIVIDGREMLPFLTELTNAVYEAKVVEFSIGTNESVRGHADWSYNSLMNEGHAGVHVAMGDGTTGPHIDFVCTDAQYARTR